MKPDGTGVKELTNEPKVRHNFGGWSKAQKEFFADGAIFDQIYRPTN